MQLLSGHVRPITALAVTPDGSRLYSAALQQQKIWEWDLTSRQVIRKLACTHSHKSSVLAMSRDGLDIACANGALRLTVVQREGGRALQIPHR